MCLLLPAPPHKRKKMFTYIKQVLTLKYSQSQIFLCSVHDLLPKSMGKDYLSSLFLDDELYEWIAQENKYASYCQRDRPESKWEGANAND